jgi:hypothetical protein
MIPFSSFNAFSKSSTALERTSTLAAPISFKVPAASAIP